mmetsp:Transcript_81210/g.226068  ORF Transcript_81210/g.226068 Transcript_81210/m.226068 type:complete len:208 (-) Transcript_81210:86-709(-)
MLFCFLRAFLHLLLLKPLSLLLLILLPLPLFVRLALLLFLLPPPWLQLVRLLGRVLRSTGILLPRLVLLYFRHGPVFCLLRLPIAPISRLSSDRLIALDLWLIVGLVSAAPFVAIILRILVWPGGCSYYPPSKRSRRRNGRMGLVLSSPLAMRAHCLICSKLPLCWLGHNVNRLQRAEQEAATAKIRQPLAQDVRGWACLHGFGRHQ